MKAGGPDPLADFLFNVKVGHCEYFSTAMAVLLRTHGIAARVVNGFLPGEYNETAGAFTVRQSDAHSWVEVYFPETRSWVTFDPTPSAGRTEPIRAGFGAQFKKYAEALELVWFQYVVGYDKQEQRTLATSIHNRVFDYASIASNLLVTARQKLPSDILSTVLLGLGVLFVAATVFLGSRVIRFGWRRGLRLMVREEDARSAVAFYQQLLALMSKRGLQRDKHLTPLEFADRIGTRDAALITRAYNRVRFGHQQLSTIELKEIERILVSLEKAAE
jgi:hypothetical protein